jgi:hypothetical protein
MITIKSKMKYYDGDIVVSLSKYHDGTTAILFQEPNGAPLAKASKNVKGIIPDHLFSQLPEYIVFIKDYSENEGVLATLVDAKLAMPAGYEVHSHHVTLTAVTLNMEMING